MGNKLRQPTLVNDRSGLFSLRKLSPKTVHQETIFSSFLFILSFLPLNAGYSSPVDCDVLLSIPMIIYR